MRKFLVVGLALVISGVLAPSAHADLAPGSHDKVTAAQKILRVSRVDGEAPPGGHIAMFRVTTTIYHAPIKLVLRHATGAKVSVCAGHARVRGQRLYVRPPSHGRAAHVLVCVDHRQPNRVRLRAVAPARAG